MSKETKSVYDKRICIIGYEASERSGWGIARHTWELLHNFKSMNRHDGVEIRFIAHGAVPKNLLIRNLKKLLFFYRMRGIRASLYHAETPILAMPLVVFNKSPSVVTVHDLLSFYKGYSAPYKEKLDYTYHSFVFDNMEGIITKAECWKQDLIRKFDVPRRKVYVVYNGVDVEKFKPIHGLRDKHVKKILYVGSPTAERGLCTLIQAFSIVSRELGDVEFIMGGKTDRNYILELSKKFGVNVKHLGFMPEEKLPTLYNSVHVFVNPPTDEFSLMLLEAMACGTPVIAREIFEMREYFGNAGIMIKSDQSDELADAIIRLLNDEGLWFKLSQKGIERAKFFTWRKTAENTYEIYAKYL